MQKEGTDKPIVLCAHHPPFLEGAYIDNDIELYKLIENYNVVLFLCGHGHRNSHWKFNGIDILMTKAVNLKEPGYRIFEFDKNGALNIFTKELGKSKAFSLTHPLQRPNHTIEYYVRSPRSDRNYEDNLPILVTLKNVQNVEISLDRKNWTLLQNSGNKYLENLDISQLSEGHHTLYVRYTHNGNEWLKFFE